MNDVTFCFTLIIGLLILAGIGYFGIKFMVKYEKNAMSFFRFLMLVVLGGGIVVIFLIVVWTIYSIFSK
jgi:hypothetical protein